MAVYTPVSRQEARTFLADYPLPDLTDICEISEGIENSNFLLVLVDGSRAILTLFEQRMNAEELPYFVGLMEHLAAAGFACPKPIARHDGSMIATLNGRAAIIVSFLEGSATNERTSANCAEIGTTLAKLHRAGEGFALRRANDQSLKRWQSMAAPLLDRLSEIDGTLPGLVESSLAAVGDHWPSTLPSGHIHADLFTDNVFFDEDGRVSGVIDFYFACHDWLAYDIAVTLDDWCLDDAGILDRAASSALIAAYQRIRPLQPAEREALPWLARGAALRFTLTRSHDWFHTPDDALVTRKDPMAYARRLMTLNQAETVYDDV